RLPVHHCRVLDVEELEVPHALQRLADGGPRVDDARTDVALLSGLVQVPEPSRNLRQEGAEALPKPLDGKKRLAARGERVLVVASHGGCEPGLCEARFDFRERRARLPHETVDISPITLAALHSLAHLQPGRTSRDGIGAYRCREAFIPEGAHR